MAALPMSWGDAFKQWRRSARDAVFVPCGIEFEKWVTPIENGIFENGI
jgi:hypothetical protein